MRCFVKIAFVVLMGALATFSEAWAKLPIELPRAGPEITVTPPEEVGKDPEEFVEEFIKQLSKQGLEVDGDVVRDPRTNAFFIIESDVGPVVEIKTPPMTPEEAEKFLKPIYGASEQLKWKHTKGG